LVPEVSAGSDAGKPAALADGPVADVFRNLATLVVEEVLPPLEMSTCTARVFDALERAEAALSQP
jgi:ATP-binding protein involved in chromosome partitioning